ncbi:major facilitator superfamily MFS_1 [Cystobacter fuscus DSM 2262]|uniref:Major facilitator superfamily MFS_1 n=1 Tax=Cystobacter fuscus (strain ATCC 25194 / DSM 2262 / NBRC 100088 / M29) TaxID=1242864 RepID=S9PRT1_CYSF2|nr:MFS transporter [Cystobacter fuscus]EPX65227.1 major facilitator superfamily MFS_1 [Cystobacter fuscus DSM 2262]
MSTRAFPFAKLWLGLFSVYLGDQILLFAVPLIIWNMTGSIAQAGVAYFIEWLPRVLFLPYGGVLIDRFGVRRVLLKTDAAKVVSCLVAFFLVKEEAGYLALLLGIFNAVLSIGNAQTVVAADAILAQTYSGDEFSRRQASISKADQCSMVLGPAFAAGLSLVIGIKQLLLAAAVFYFFNYINIRFILRHVQEETRPESSRSVLGDLQVGISVLAEHKFLLLLTCVAALNNMLIGMLEAAGAAIITGRLNKPDSFFSLMNVIAGLNGVFALSLVPLLLKRMTVRTLGTLSFCLLCLSGVIANVADGFWFFLVGFGLMIGSSLLLGVYFRTVRATLIPREHMGKAVGLITCLNQASLPLTGLLLTAYGDSVGPQPLGLIITGVLVLVGGAVLSRDATKKVEIAPEGA